MVKLKKKRAMPYKFTGEIARAYDKEEEEKPNIKDILAPAPDEPDDWYERTIERIEGSVDSLNIEVTDNSAQRNFGPFYVEVEILDNPEQVAPSIPPETGTRDRIQVSAGIEIEIPW